MENHCANIFVFAKTEVHLLKRDFLSLEKFPDHPKFQIAGMFFCSNIQFYSYFYLYFEDLRMVGSLHAMYIGYSEDI